MWQQGIRRRRAKVQEDRTVVFQNAPQLRSPFVTPGEIIAAGLAVRVTTVGYAEVVRRRGDHEIDRTVAESLDLFDAIAESKIEGNHAEALNGRRARTRKNA